MTEKDDYEDFIESEKLGEFLEQLDEFGCAYIDCGFCGEQNRIGMEDFEPFCYFCEADLESPFDKYSEIISDQDN